MMQMMKLTLKPFQPLSVVMTMVPTLMRQFKKDCCKPKRLSQMFLVCYILLNSQIISINNSVEKGIEYLRCT